MWVQNWRWHRSGFPEKSPGLHGLRYLCNGGTRRQPGCQIRPADARQNFAMQWVRFYHGNAQEGRQLHTQKSRPKPARRQERRYVDLSINPAYYYNQLLHEHLQRVRKWIRKKIEILWLVRGIERHSNNIPNVQLNFRVYCKHSVRQPTLDDFPSLQPSDSLCLSLYFPSLKRSHFHPHECAFFVCSSLARQLLDFTRIFCTRKGKDRFYCIFLLIICKHVSPQVQPIMITMRSVLMCVCVCVYSFYTNCARVAGRIYIELLIIGSYLQSGGFYFVR